VGCLKEINITFKNEEEKIKFVNESEINFEKRLDLASKEIVNSGVSCVLLSGPTCAGKTTTAQKIIADFKEKGKNVTVISIDDFFKDRTEKREVKHGEKIDYDSVDVLDLVTLEECINSAKPGNTIKVPIFDFITQSRIGYNEHYISDNEVLLFEGIQAVYPEITSLFNEAVLASFNTSVQPMI
jgi:uridine kinase